MLKFRKYLKLAVAVLAAVAVAAQAALTDDVITPAEWVTIAIALLGALGVWRVPNGTPAPPDPPATLDQASTTSSYTVGWPPPADGPNTR